MGRRRFLLGTAAAATALASPALLRAAPSAAPEDAFLAVSRLLVNHELNPAVSARMAAWAATAYPGLEGLLG